jgi:hypothetical protein
VLASGYDGVFLKVLGGVVCKGCGLFVFLDERCDMWWYGLGVVPG